MNTKKLQKIYSRLSRFSGVLRYSSRAPPPAYIMMMITYDCNLSCPFCNQKELQEAGGGEEMSLAEIRRIESNIDFFHRPRIHLFGGEPTHHSSFREVVNFLGEKGYRLSLTTNGVEQDWVQETTVDKLHEINISINTPGYSYTKDLVDKLNSFEQTPEINVNIPVTPENHTELAEIARDISGKDPSYIVFQHLQFSRDDKINEEIDTAELKSQIEKINEIDIPAGFFPAVKDGKIENYYSDPGFPGTKCVAPWLRMEILPSGKVASCKWLVPDADVVVGDAMEENLSGIWNGEKFRDIRKKIRKKGVYEDGHCFRCCFRDYR